MHAGTKKLFSCKSLAVVFAVLCGLSVMLNITSFEVTYANDDVLQVGAITDPNDSYDPPSSDPKPVLNGWVKNKAGTAWNYWKNGKQVKSKWIDTNVKPAGLGGTAGVHRYWIDQNGKLAISRLINKDSSRDKLAKYCAYATKHGYVATSKTRVDNKIYLVRNNKKRPGWLESGNKAAGRLYTAKYSSDSKKHFYYISKKAHAVITGKAVKIAGYGWVYNLSKKGYAVTGITKFDTTHLLLCDKYGRLNRQTQGWLKTNAYAGSTEWYYIEKTKKNKDVCGARIGYFKVDGKRYLGLKKVGYLLRNTRQIVNGKYYRVDNRGCITYDTVVNGLIRKASGYWSPSRYLIMVDIDNPCTMVFQGRRGHWKVKYIWKCCTGKRSSPTITGRFSIKAKGHSFGEDHGYSCYYWTQFCGDYLFHSRKYHPYTHKLMDGRMGRRVSMGCVRLYDKNAIWIQRHAPIGTTVVCTR